MSDRRLKLACALLLLAGCAPQAPRLNTPANSLNNLQATATRVEQAVSQQRLESLAAILTGKAPAPDGKLIAERGTREGREQTRQFLSHTLTEMGYTPERHEYRSQGINILTRLMAEQPSDEYILIGAHLDSVRNAGADDNNSGTVSVLEAARVLKDLKGRQRNIIFAWFDEEELGLIGSYALARDLKKQGLKIQSVHTLDMVGWDGDQDRTIEIEQPDGELWAYYNMVNEKHGLKLPLVRTSSGSTDHVAFRETGFKSVGMCEEWANKDTTPYYHRKTDTYETINFAYLTQVARLATAVVADLSQKVPAPMVYEQVPHDRFPSRPRFHHASYDGLPLE